MCQAEEGMLPPRGAHRQREFKLRPNFSELERPRWQRSLSQSIRFSDFFLGSVLPNSKCYIIEISS